VLLVDDDVNVREVTRGMPEELGCLVARTRIEIRSFDRTCRTSAPLYINDINMPSVDGHELAQRATRLRPALKVLQLSGREGFDDPKGFLRERLPRCVFPLAARPARSDLPNDRRCSVAGNSRPWRLLALSNAFASCRFADWSFPGRTRLRDQAALSRAHSVTCAWVANQTSPLALACRINSSRIQIRER